MKSTGSIILTFSFLVIATIAMAQTDTVFNQTDQMNHKQGYWKKYYPNGKIAYQGFFKDDRPVGEFRRFHEDGSLKVILQYNPTGTYSKAQFYTTDGKLIAEGFYAEKQKDSLWLYYDSNSQLVYEERYAKGLKQGKFKQYYNNGKVYESAPYVNGNIDGVLVQFFPNGLNKSIINFSNGLQNGPLKVFYPNGKLRIEGFYKDGLKEGEWKFYTQEGSLLTSIKYEKGEPENKDAMIEKESKELEGLLRNAGKIQEPTIEDFLEKMGTKY